MTASGQLFRTRKRRRQPDGGKQMAGRAQPFNETSIQQAAYSSINMAALDVSGELSALDRILTRLAVSDDEQLEKVSSCFSARSGTPRSGGSPESACMQLQTLQKLLPLVVEKLSTESPKVRAKVRSLSLSAPAAVASATAQLRADGYMDGRSYASASASAHAVECQRVLLFVLRRKRPARGERLGPPAVAPRMVGPPPPMGP
jgi:hypothetical protein